MAEEQSSWSTLAKVLTGIAGLLTAFATFYSTIHKSEPPAKNSAEPAVVQMQPVSSQSAASGSVPANIQTSAAPSPAPTSADTRLAPNLAGIWQARGNFQDGTPYAGQINFAPNSYFQMGAQGVTTASGTWRLDPASRNLSLDGQHVLYGAPLQFRCALGPASQTDDAWSGQCRDSTGVGTIQLTRY